MVKYGGGGMYGTDAGYYKSTGGKVSSGGSSTKDSGGSSSSSSGGGGSSPAKEAGIKGVAPATAAKDPARYAGANTPVGKVSVGEGGEAVFTSKSGKTQTLRGGQYQSYSGQTFESEAARRAAQPKVATIGETTIIQKPSGSYVIQGEPGGYSEAAIKREIVKRERNYLKQEYGADLSGGQQTRVDTQQEYTFKEFEEPKPHLVYDVERDTYLPVDENVVAGLYERYPDKYVPAKQAIMEVTDKEIIGDKYKIKGKQVGYFEDMPEERQQEILDQSDKYMVAYTTPDTEQMKTPTEGNIMRKVQDATKYFYNVEEKAKATHPIVEATIDQTKAQVLGPTNTMKEIGTLATKAGIPSVGGAMVSGAKGYIGKTEGARGKITGLGEQADAFLEDKFGYTGKVSDDKTVISNYLKDKGVKVVEPSGRDSRMFGTKPSDYAAVAAGVTYAPAMPLLLAGSALQLPGKGRGEITEGLIVTGAGLIDLPSSSERQQQKVIGRIVGTYGAYKLGGWALGKVATKVTQYKPVAIKKLTTEGQPLSKVKTEQVSPTEVHTEFTSYDTGTAKVIYKNMLGQTKTIDISTTAQPHITADLYYSKTLTGTPQDAYIPHFIKGKTEGYSVKFDPSPVTTDPSRGVFIGVREPFLYQETTTGTGVYGKPTWSGTDSYTISTGKYKGLGETPQYYYKYDLDPTVTMPYQQAQHGQWYSVEKGTGTGDILSKSTPERWKSLPVTRRDYSPDLSQSQYQIPIKDIDSTYLSPTGKTVTSHDVSWAKGMSKESVKTHKMFARLDQQMAAEKYAYDKLISDAKTIPPRLIDEPVKTSIAPSTSVKPLPSSPTDIGVGTTVVRQAADTGIAKSVSASIEKLLPQLGSHAPQGFIPGSASASATFMASGAALASASESKKGTARMSQVNVGNIFDRVPITKQTPIITPTTTTTTTTTTKTGTATTFQPTPQPITPAPGIPGFQIEKPEPPIPLGLPRFEPAKPYRQKDISKESAKSERRYRFIFEKMFKTGKKKKKKRRTTWGF